MTNTFTAQWLDVVSEVWTRGEQSSPRNNRTKELIGRSISFDMNYPILCVPRRNLGPAFLAAEPAWILSGSNFLSDISPYAEMMERFSDDSVFLSGAYGPKLVDQLPYIIKTLETDTHSRQAVINIWREKPQGSKDTPCTLSYQFFIRGGKLHMVATMRSNDVWLGMPYDVFTQTMIAYAVCLLLRSRGYLTLTLGTLTLNVGSQHLYEQRFGTVEDIMSDEDNLVDYSDFGSETSLKFDYSESYTDLIDYLWYCAEVLKSGYPILEGFLQGLQPKGSDSILIPT